MFAVGYLVAGLVWERILSGEEGNEIDKGFTILCWPMSMVGTAAIKVLEKFEKKEP